MSLKEKLEKIIKKPSQGPLVSLSLLIESHQVIDKDFDLNLDELYAEITNQNQEVLQSFRKIYTEFLWEDNESLDAYPKNSEERRNKINEILGLPPKVVDTLNLLIKFGEPQIIQIFSTEPSKPWLENWETKFHYWSTLKRHLNEKKLKNNPKKKKIIDELDESSSAVLDYLEPPITKNPYQTKGLVIGHVQSGKTLHMEAVVSKAIDCGYKIIIILCGRNKILRQQTQKRFDQDIFGREIIHPDIADWNNVDFDEFSADKDYFDDPAFRVAYSDPSSTFVSHGFKPDSSTGDVLVKRVTDYSDNGLPSGRIPSSPFTFQGENNIDSLKSVPAHFAAIVKSKGSLSKIIKLLSQAGSNALKNMPALIIDDESDSASLTPYAPLNSDGFRDEEDIQSTNLKIRELIKLLPRAQYIAYTATPYANVFVNSDDKDDLFPKDFISLLNEPEDYMGPKDFISDDPSKNFPDPEFSPFVRDAFLSEENSSIQNALDDFLLSGAIKLYREKSMGLNFGEKYEHHTMLVHTSHLNKEQEEKADIVQEIWDNGDYTSAGLKRLEIKFNEDFKITNSLLKNYSVDYKLPDDFKEIIPFINMAKRLIGEAPNESSDKIYLLINNLPGNSPPSFVKENNSTGIWKVFVGGNMLSRGYTIPDLTVSYFTRVVQAGDTLEQMARWFGYRPGYKDLVRVYFARDARSGSRDIYEDFVDICKTEAGLRNLLSNLPENKEERFLRDLSPKEFGIYVVQEGRVPPTSGQKMRNIGTVSENFSGKLFDKSQSFPPQGSKQDKNNFEKFIDLINSTELEKKEFNFSLDKSPREFWVGEYSTSKINSFLSESEWTVDDPTKILRWYLDGNLTCPKSKVTSDYFIKTHTCTPNIDKWKLLINNGASNLPSKFSNFNYKNYNFVVVARSQREPQGWKTLESQQDRKYINYIMTGSKPHNSGPPNKSLELEHENNIATLHGYLIDNKENPSGKPSFGWILRLPVNSCRNEIKLIPENQLFYEQN